MSKNYQRQVELDGEYGDYFQPHQNKNNRRAKRLEELAKKKRYLREEDGDFDT